jgi:hypothetical protein
MNRLYTAAALLFLLTCAPLTASAQPKDDPLAEGFKNPPAEAQMRMFWHVFGPAWEPAEIDYQFDLLNQAHVGGLTTFFFYPVAVDDPAKGVQNQRLLSPEFLKTLKYAAESAKRHNIRLTFAGGSGWPFGGPMVRPEDSAQRMRRVIVQPPKDGTSFALPTLRQGEKYFAAFMGGRNVTQHIKGNMLVDPHMSVKTNMLVKTYSSTETVQLFITGPTFMQVKRPALGGEGLVVDHFNTKATLRFMETAVKPLLDAAPGLIRSIFCDSLEVYNANWTHDFPQEFRRRCGYDLIQRLPELFDKDAPAGPDLRFDFWRTLAEMTEERFIKPVSDWCHKHGVQFEMEAYGTPPNPFTAARYIDVPTGEQYEWKGFSFSRFAASGAHLTGKRIIGAEAWTWTGIPNRLADSLSDLKLTSDMHFLAGCNDLTGVDFAYSPRNVGAPGWLPYYGPVFNQNNPQWEYFRHLADYVSRCQWMLRQGKPVADVAIYLPVEDIFAKGPVEQMPLDFRVRDHFVTGEKTGEFSLKIAFKHHSDLIHTLITNGYNFDGIDFWTINRLARVKNGKLVCGDGEYSVVILPGLEGMDLKALEKLAEFVKQGGTLIAIKRLPDRVYGTTRESKGARTRLHESMDQLFGSEEVRSRHQWRRLDLGRSILSADERDELLQALEGWGSGSSIQYPSFGTEPYQPFVTFVQRKLGDRFVYFVANLDDKPAVFDATFGVPADYVRLWDPMTGSISGRRRAGHSQAGTHLENVMLPARGSRFFVLDNEDTGGWEQSADATLQAVSQVLSASWRISFEGPDAPKPRETTDLLSWTTWPDVKFFSGKGIYETEFTWEGPLPKRCRLAFDQVKEVAEVFVNGQQAGVIWTPPNVVEITKLLKPGKNTLKVVVVNLPVNRYIGLPDEDLKALRAAYGNRFPDSQEKRVMKEPAPSGLIGKAQLLIER